MNDTPELFPTSASSRDKPPGKIGGCVGTFLQFFEWNPRKRLFSTKRLPAERPTARKATSTAAKKYKDERMPVAKLLLLADEENRGGFPSPKKVSSVSSADRVSEDGAMGKRVPGVVARLMGLESLPDEGGNDGRHSPQQQKQSPPVEVRPLQELLHTRPEPVLLPDLLSERDYLEAQKQQYYSSKDRLQVPVPGFVKKLPTDTAGGGYNYLQPRDGFRRPSLKSDPPYHLQPYADQKYNRSMRPLKRASTRDLSDPKHLILALSPRASGDGGMRPILLPSKVHNKLMNSPIKSPTKMGSRSARLLEAAVKILEPNLQPNASRPRVPPVRTSSLREFRDLEREFVGMAEEIRRERPITVDKKVPAAASSNAARVLKGQSMNRSWNGRDDAALRYTGGSMHDSSGSKKRSEQHSHLKGAAASPMRVGNRNRGYGRSMMSQDDINLNVMEEIKTVVPQGFEGTYGVGGLKPLNVGKRDEMRMDSKYDLEERTVLLDRERNIVSSLSSLSSLSVENSPYSECSDRSTTSSFHDPLRRSGSAKEGVGVSFATPMASKSRFMRSKSVKEERSSSSKMSGGSSSSGTPANRISAREMRVKQEIPQQAHQVQRQASQRAQEQQHLAPPHEVFEVSHDDTRRAQHHQNIQQNDQQQQAHLQDLLGRTEAGVSSQPVRDDTENDLLHALQRADVEFLHDFHPSTGEGMTDLQDQFDDLVLPIPVLPSEFADVDDFSQSRNIEISPAGFILERDDAVTDARGEKPAEVGPMQDRGVAMVVIQSPRTSPPGVAPPIDESSSSVSSSHRSSSSGSRGSSPVSSSKEIPTSRSSTSNGGGGGLLSYSRLFGSRKSGDKKSSDHKSKGRARDEPRKSESSLVRTLLRRKSAPQPATSPSPGPVQSMDKPKKRGGRKGYAAAGMVSSRDGNEPGLLAGYYSEPGGVTTRGRGFDMAAVIQANRFTDNEDECKERIIHADSDANKDSPLKTVDEVFPDKVAVDKGCLRLLDEWDETGSQRLIIEGFDCVNDDGEESFREGIRNYAAHLMDDLKLDIFSSGGTLMQGSGRNGFSYSPLVVELEEPPPSLLDSGFTDGGVEVEKCLLYLGRTADNTSLASPDNRSVVSEGVTPHPEQLEACDEKPQSQQPRAVAENESDSPAIANAKEMLLNELSEARKIVDTAFEEATERVAKKLSSAGRVALAGADGEDEAVCASAVVNDDCGQPSPVSVLDYPFEEDESRSSQGNLLREGPCEVEEEEFDEDDEEFLIDDLLLESATAVGLKPKGKKVRKKAPTLRVTATDTGVASTKTQTEKIVEAIIDISRNRCIDPSECALSVQNLGSCPEEDEDYVSTILSVWEQFPEASGNAAGANSELPITTTLFDRLESQGRATAWKQDKERESELGSATTPRAESEVGLPARRSLKQWQGLWLHRRLLFDCVNETLAYSLKFRYPDPWMGIPVLRTPPTGRALVKEVYSDMNECRHMETEELDTIIDVDMGKGFGSWSNLNQEIGEIGLEIERTLLRVMIDDLVSEIMNAGGCAGSIPDGHFLGIQET